ncbi:hypothetical protein PsYK624_142440 [Phanerochaete sordida]|uniref:Uncharacterized protein n=1 Tax=Phanerochaete sordida TaxID=48140 RepID=A0A9P3LL81_9APHY|nr:hypothetical protein PsYK624_142440 [Phanerochaete sordida]
MSLTRLLTAALLVAAAAAASVPPLAARQSPSICGSAGEILLASKLQLWTDTATFGYLSASPAGVPFWGQTDGYGVTTDPSEALTGIFACAPDGLANWPPRLLGASNARNVPGTTVNAIGLVDPSYASNGDPTVNARDSLNWLAFSPTPVGDGLSTPIDSGLTYDSSPAVWESVAWTQLTLAGQPVLQPIWTNPAGDSIDVPLFVSPSKGVVVAPADGNAFQTEYASDGPWTEIFLALVD